MIVEMMEQGTEEWLAIRRGVPTASCFGKILTATTLKRSASCNGYLNQLAAESVGIVEDWSGSSHTDRGTELEPQAIAYYEFVNDVVVQRPGFVWRDERKLVGGSPDGLVGEDGGVEIKCHSAKVHIERLHGNKIPAEYLAQVYGCLWLTGREWWDFLAFHPSFARQLEVRVTIEDEDYQRWIDAWEPEIESFCQRLKVAKAKVAEWYFGSGG